MASMPHPAMLKILVVDDEPDVSQLVRQKFRRRMRQGELDFVYAYDGVEALDALEEHSDIDIVLTDINMPRMDGLTLLAEMNKQDRLLKAIVISAYGDLDNIRKAMNQGAFDFLMKPINLNDLEITIDKVGATVEQQKRAQVVRAAFGRYLSDEVVNTLLDDPTALKLGGEKRPVTMMMSDLRGFSTLSEQFPPEQVVEVLNIYLGRMADIIAQHHGTINEFIGDAIFVLFGAPVRRDDDATRAVACAIAMQQAMADVNAALAERDLPPLEMGIGINTGDVVVGNIGSEKRTKYAAVGHHVNLTSRIESYTVGGQILISASTRDAAGDALQLSRQLHVSVKGFSEPIPIFEVEGIGGPYDLQLPEQAEAFADLADPLAVRCTILDGKHLSNETHVGTFTHLAPSGARLRTTCPMELLANLKIALHPDGPDAPSAGDLYAKVVGRTDGATQIRFTAVPVEVADLLRGLRTEAV